MKRKVKKKEKKGAKRAYKRKTPVSLISDGGKVLVDTDSIRNIKIPQLWFIDG